MKMKHPLLIPSLALAAACLVGTAFAKHPNPLPQIHQACDKKFAEMITDLEHRSWDLHKTHDLTAARALFADDFFEVLAFGGAPSSRQDLLDLIESGQFTVYDYVITEDFVVRTTEISALISYRIIVNYDYYGVNYTDDLRATSSYARIKGRWRCSSYHETYTYIP